MEFKNEEMELNLVQFPGIHYFRCLHSYLKNVNWQRAHLDLEISMVMSVLLHPSVMTSGHLLNRYLLRFHFDRFLMLVGFKYLEWGGDAKYE